MTADLAIAQLLLSTLLIGVTFIWGIFRYRRGGYWRRGVHHKLQAYLLWALSGLIALSCFVPLAYLYTEHLWFENVGYADVFWNLQRLRWGIFGVFFIVAAGFMNANAAIAHVLCPESREFRRWTHTQTFSFHRIVLCITLIAALLLAIPMLLLDDIVLRYLNKPAAAVEGNDYFGMDRNFYLFSFPLHRWVSLWVEITLWVTCLVVGVLYNFYYRRDAHTMARVKRHIIFHGSTLWLLLLIVGGWRSYVNLWGKVYTTPLTKALKDHHGQFYVDFHQAGATKIYCGVLIGIAIVIVINIFWRKRLLWYVTVAVWGLSYVLLIHIYPRGLHMTHMRVDVIPKEREYLQTHIEETRRAFELDEIVRVDWKPGNARLEMITENPEIKKNIQIWDRRVVSEAFRDLQIENHYNFHPYTDVDRYTVDGEYRQVLIAARELDPAPDITSWDQLKTDLNKPSLTYGYGVCVVPVNEFVGEDKEGLPNFWVKNMPIESKHEELQVTYPQIYYGEMIRNYLIVTPDREVNLDPEISEWMQHTYAGDGGVPLDSWFRRLCFALRFDFIPILMSKNLTPESRIMFRRKIGTRRNERLVKDRISYIAPFLNYDPDPYIVINDGKLYWIIDFYVTSRYYPNAQMYVDDQTRLTDRDLYEEPDFDTFNYIRNAGVAVVDAYTGAVDFYAIKKNEKDGSVMQTYQEAFPKLFKSISEMPAGLAAHLRYPDYLTRIQATLYGDYYRPASAFFNKVKAWAIPKEAYYSSKADQEMMPYYAMLKLPGEEKVEFVNMIPFAPWARKKQLKAWMVARCDQPHYGERIVYVLPDNEGIPGPTQVENDINNKTGSMPIYRQDKSDVIRGNLLLIPVDDALFYFEAIYLQAKKPQGEEDDDKSPRPKLAMVVLQIGSNDPEAVPAKTFDEVFKILLDGGTQTPGEKQSTRDELIQQYKKGLTDNAKLLDRILELTTE